MTPKEALEISRKVAENVEQKIKDVVGRSDAGIIVGIGKDGTPTKKIDKLSRRCCNRNPKRRGRRNRK